VLGGDAVNEGGRLYIDGIAKVMGRIKAESEHAETKAERGFRHPDLQA
jgi:hypothetical protein